ncbi:hypothetical protein HUU51_05685, partial [Candidatus Gracilibacteria bacterium]|nr:hypothetical protein [Candidatus Gracilibacteria bacterium]
GTCNYTSVGTYTPTCFVNGTVTSPTCQQTVSVNNSSSSSSSGGSTYQCRDISMTGNQITCTGNHLVQTFRLSCNGSFLFAPAVLGSSNTTSATFTCNDNRATCSVYNQPVTESSFYSWATNPACTLTPSSSSSSGGSTSSSSSSGGSTSSSSSSGGSTSSSSSSGGSSPDYCGDGVVQRPNQNLQTEECDFGTGVWPAWCSKTTCKIDGIVTYPNDGEIVFGPKDNLIIGNNMNPYVAYSLDKPSIYNNSPYDLYFDSLCVVKKSGTTINGNIDCRPLGTALGRGLFPGEKFSFSTYPNFIGDTSTLPSGTNFGDNVLVTTIEHESKTYTDAYFASELKVRVSKPSIATTGGGTSYISNTANISNISEVSKDILDSDKNKNFVGAGVSSGNISSYSSDINDTSSVEKISQEGSKYNNAANTTTNITLPSIGTTSNLGDFNNYNGINNAFILKNTSFIVSMNTFSGLNGPRTYIIENGDLIINSNINYSNNIAFVVKGGNIKIDKSVNSINGTYISIPYGSNGGDIMGVNGKTNTILNIKGSIYGNLDKLVSQRDYVKENSGLLSVGTIVSFGSSVFRDPAPLTSTFINEYMEATKVAK